MKDALFLLSPVIINTSIHILFKIFIASFEVSFTLSLTEIIANISFSSVKNKTVFHSINKSSYFFCIPFRIFIFFSFIKARFQIKYFLSSISQRIHFPFIISKFLLGLRGISLSLAWLTIAFEIGWFELFLIFKIFLYLEELDFKL